MNRDLTHETLPRDESVSRGQSSRLPVEERSEFLLFPEAASPFSPSLFGRALLGLIWVYRHFVSTPLHLVAGPSCGCRFYPTCSDYAAQSIRAHGPWTGSFFALRRLLRCTPLHPGGVDFVPASRALRPRCTRSISARLSS